MTPPDMPGQGLSGRQGLTAELDGTHRHRLQGPHRQVEDGLQEGGDHLALQRVVRVKMSSELRHVRGAVNPDGQLTGGAVEDPLAGGGGGGGSQQELQVVRQGGVEDQGQGRGGQTGEVDAQVVGDGEEEGEAVVDMFGHRCKGLLSESLEEFLVLFISELHRDGVILRGVRDHHQVGGHEQGLFVRDTQEVAGGLGVEGHDEDDKIARPHRPLLLAGEEHLHDVGLTSSAAVHVEISDTTSLEGGQDCNDNRPK